MIDTTDKIAELKQEHQKQMETYAKVVREYIHENGNDNCDYLIHNRLMESYYRGAWNALNKIEN